MAISGFLLNRGYSRMKGTFLLKKKKENIRKAAPCDGHRNGLSILTSYCS